MVLEIDLSRIAPGWGLPAVHIALHADDVGIRAEQPTAPFVDVPDESIPATKRARSLWAPEAVDQSCL